jgi:hypothetical protein
MKLKYLIIFIILLSVSVLAQIEPQIQLYRSDAKGNASYKREGIMDGNLVRTLFYNTGEVAYYGFQPSGEWPKGTGHSYIDGVCVLIGSSVQTNSQRVHPIESNYREEVDKDPITGELWGLQPVPYYANPSSTNPAINKDENSWPSTWPAALGLSSEWNGYWYGYFGRGVMNSDFETFFVMDDNKDGEFRRAPHNYYPIKSDTTWGGLGLRVEVRGFQWSHVLAEDIIFWHYDIVNISDYDLDTTCFGFYSDPGVGGTDDNGDNVLYDALLDLTYAWDSDDSGIPDSWDPGYYGYAYLESPGNAVNGIDDDQDGMIDESRDDGLDNDGDWIGYLDVNGNGKWDADENEPLNNDVGADGVGPFDEQYLGPDEGEGDGIPTDGEPNFDKTDKDESDQLGLMAVSLTILSDKSTTGIWPKNDEVMWGVMTGGFKNTQIDNNNVSMVFSSGPFPLKLNKRERFSMALIFGENLEDLIFNKETVQEIYNANYNFLKPPATPTLTAVAGDKKVFLYWDNKAEESRDAFMGYEIPNDPTSGPKKDFEGYLIYRSNEPEFNDIKIITDSKGDAKYWKPIAQYDLVDTLWIDSVNFEEIKGPDPIGINGAHFWRGSQTGLQHSYVDENVVNGQRYYYAVVSYDQGDPYRGTSGLQPTECTKIITEDYSGVVEFIDRNCAIVTPNAPVAGYIPPQIEGNVSQASGVGTGKLSMEILNPDAILQGASYKVEFKSTVPNPILYSTSSFDVYRTYNGQTDTLLTDIDSTNFGAGKAVTPFDGMTFSVLNDTVNVVDSLTGWLQGTANYVMMVRKDGTVKALPTPKNYELQFADSPADTTAFTKVPVPVTIMNTTDGVQADVELVDVDNSKSLTVGDSLKIIEYVSAIHNTTNFRTAWVLSYELPRNPNITPDEPGAGDVFRVATSKPFKSGDSFTFSTIQASSDASLAKDNLGRISVVPNPYLGAAYWERRNLNSTGRGERRIDFINLPATCTVRIYTVTGALVKTLQRDSGFSDGSLSWNLISDDGMDIAYGVYIYHVDAPGIGEHIGKFAVIK